MTGTTLDLRIMGRVDAILASRRDSAKRAMEARRSHAFSVCPMLEDLEFELNSTNVETSKRVLDGTLSVSMAKKQITEVTAVIREKQQDLLIYHGLPSNQFLYIPTCVFCGDTGRVKAQDGRTDFCACYEELKRIELLAVSNIRGRLRAGFEIFDETLFPEIYRNKNGDIIGYPMSSIMECLRVLKRFIDTFRDQSPSAQHDNLYFFGQTGTGKTYFAISVGLELIKLGMSVIFYTAPNMLNIITAHRMKAFSDDKYDETPYTDLFDADVLIIDDWGTESLTASRYSEYLTLFNERQTHGAKSTIITSNLSMQEVRGRFDKRGKSIDEDNGFDERVYSRIMGSFKFFEFIGPDIRETIRRRNSKSPS